MSFRIQGVPENVIKAVRGDRTSKFRHTIYGRNVRCEKLKGNFPLFQGDGLIDVAP